MTYYPVQLAKESIIPKCEGGDAQGLETTVDSAFRFPDFDWLTVYSEVYVSLYNQSICENKGLKQ